MPGEDTTPQHKSSESVTEPDVQRLLNIALAGAGVVEGLSPRTQSGTITLYGEYSIHHDKPFRKYAELSMVSAFRLEAKKGNKSLREEMDEWARSVSLKNKCWNKTQQ
jgi:hypothetical protein